jgi:aryl-alcohol dehydrogenase-like predicted oxidoreductase
MRGIAGGKLSAKFENLKDEALREKVRGFLQFTGEGKADDLVHLSLAYLLAAPEVSSIIIGSRRAEHVEANAKAASRPVPPEVIKSVREYLSKA